MTNLKSKLMGMKLKDFVKMGYPMLSNYTSLWCCQVSRINTKMLLEIPLRDICNIPMAGEVASREIERSILNYSK